MAFIGEMAAAVRRQARRIQALRRSPLGISGDLQAMLQTGIYPDFIVGSRQ